MLEICYILSYSKQPNTFFSERVTQNV